MVWMTYQGKVGTTCGDCQAMAQPMGRGGDIKWRDLGLTYSPMTCPEISRVPLSPTSIQIFVTLWLFNIAMV